MNHNSQSERRRDGKAEASASEEGGAALRAVGGVRARDRQRERREKKETTGMCESVR